MRASRNCIRERYDDLKVCLRSLILVCLLSHGMPSMAQANNEKYTMPGEFQLFENSEQYKGQWGLGYDISGHFYPIGWSANGKFAYIKLFNQSPSDDVWISLMVYDMAKNQASSKWEYETMDDDTTLVKEGMRGVWKRWHSTISKELDSLGIKQSIYWKPIERDSIFESYYSLDPDSDEVPYTVPYWPYAYSLNPSVVSRELMISHGKRDYTISAAIRMKGKNSAFFPIKSISDHSFALKSGVQLIKQGPRIAEPDDELLSIDLLHAFADPSGKRVVFVYRKYRLGFEGPPNSNDFEIGGFELDP